MYGNAGGDYSSCLAGQQGVNGNFSSNPLFCDPDNGGFTLSCGCPSPFNSTTTIGYSIDRDALVTLNIYNVAGQLVRTLVNERQSPEADRRMVVWDGTNARGHPVSSGVYFCGLWAGGRLLTRKIHLVR